MSSPIPPEIASLTAVKVFGVVSSDEIAKMSQQLFYLTRWAEFLDSVDWTKVQFKQGPATVAPPKPPAWP
jgi:hypothetical protein